VIDPRPVEFYERDEAEALYAAAEDVSGPGARTLTTPVTAPSLSRITGAPLIPGTTSLAVIRPTDIESSHAARPAHCPIAVRDRIVRWGSLITLCPVTVTVVRGVTWSGAISGPAIAGKGMSAPIRVSTG